MKKESKFQKELIDEIEKRFPGSMVLKNDSHYKQGIPDLTVFYKKHWATLECKKSKDEHHQPHAARLMVSEPKTDSEKHGFGVNQIKEIVEAYSGMTDFYEEDGFFIVNMFIPK